MSMIQTRGLTLGDSIINQDRRIPVMSGCVLWLPLYKMPGTTIKSRDAYGHSCTVTGATYGRQGRTFDGSDDRIAVASGADTVLDLITAMTYEVWVYPSDGGDDYGRFLSKTDASPYATRVCFLGKELADETNVRWEHTDLTDMVLNSGAGDMTSGAWNHVVGTYANTPYRAIYVNGALVANDAPTGTVTSTAGGSLWIGALYTTVQNFKGIIGEVRIYNRALSLAEIAHNYNVTNWRYK